MKKLAMAVLSALGLIGLSAGSAAAWDDSYRYCPGARWCSSAYYSPSFHRGPYYRFLPEYGQGYFRYYAGPRGKCVSRGRWHRCR